MIACWNIEVGFLKKVFFTIITYFFYNVKLRLQCVAIEGHFIWPCRPYSLGPAGPLTFGKIWRAYRPLERAKKSHIGGLRAGIRAESLESGAMSMLRGARAF